MDTKAQALELLGVIAGGGLSGLIDAETSQTMPGGLPVGAWFGVGLVAAGFVGASSKGTLGKIAAGAMDLGMGALAGEAHSAVASRVTAAKIAAGASPDSVLHGVQGVGALPAGRPSMTHESLRSHIAQARRAA